MSYMGYLSIVLIIIIISLTSVGIRKFCDDFSRYLILQRYMTCDLQQNICLCVLLDSPPRLDVTGSIKTEYSEYAEDVKMDTDYYDVAEPQVDIIQTCDAQTQTTPTLEQQVLRRLQSLEKSVNALREGWRRDQVTQQANVNRILENQNVLMEKLFGKLSKTDGKTKD